MNQLTGTVKNIRGPYNNNWFILSLIGGHTVTGCKPQSIQIGDHCTFTGKFKNTKYGRQLAFEQVKVEIPKDRVGLALYLQRYLPGIGPQIAKRIMNKFGSEVFSILDGNYKRLSEVKGISVTGAKKISLLYKKIKDSQQHDLFYTEHGISLNLRSKLIEAYSSDENVVKLLKKNPYRIIDNIDGFGFLTADRINQSIRGTSLDNPFRINTGLAYVLRTAEQQGHCYLPEAELLKRAKALLAFPVEEYARDNFIIEQDRVYNPDMFQAEQTTADRLRKILHYPDTHIVSDISPEDIACLSEDQSKAFDFAVNKKVCIITGGPGTGKTYMLAMILKAFSGLDIALCSPTGKAAQRMTESTKQEASTIHRLLKYNHKLRRFLKDETDPLEHDVIIVDESSMIDIRLMAALLKAIPDSSRIIFIGDSDQLPSVGPGRVLSDMIDAGIPTARLTTLHRQAENSLITRNAQHINKGEPLELGDMDSDFIYLQEQDKSRIADRIVNACQYHKEESPQVLCPQNKGEIGTFKLNARLRDEVFNPGGIPITGTPFRKGDKVIQLRNNYELEIFNGDVGYIMDTGNSDTFSILFDRKLVDYPKDKTEELALAYALTIHKSQGSEFNTVITPIHETNWIMLKRQLFYTGITRGKKKVILFGTDKAVRQAIKTPDVKIRYSGLPGRLAANITRQTGI